METPETSTRTILLNEAIDMDQMFSSYFGRKLVKKLLFVADHCESLAEEALRRAKDELLRGMDIATYEDVCRRLQAKGMHILK